MCLFSLGEAWGPVSCEDPGCACKRDIQTVQLTEKEWKQLLNIPGSKAAAVIIEEKMGTALCSKHL